MEIGEYKMCLSFVNKEAERNLSHSLDTDTEGEIHWRKTSVGFI